MRTITAKQTSETDNICVLKYLLNCMFSKTKLFLKQFMRESKYLIEVTWNSSLLKYSFLVKQILQPGNGVFI